MPEKVNIYLNGFYIPRPEESEILQGRLVVAFFQVMEGDSGASFSDTYSLSKSNKPTYCLKSNSVKYVPFHS